MKNLNLSWIILLILFAACGNKDANEVLPFNSNQCVVISQNSDWAIEDFKTGYTIQFPDKYEGSGMIGFEGNTFRKTRVDKKVLFIYSYCTGLYCFDFGEALAEPAPPYIIAKDESGNEVVLDLKKEFCVEGETEGIFYYNRKVDAFGKFFMRRETKFLEGLTIYFDFLDYQEVENIIKTISKRSE